MSFNTIVMPVMVIDAINLEEELASMNAEIKHQNEHITDLTELEQRLPKASNKGLLSEESDKESNLCVDSNKKHKSKKDLSLHSL